MATDAQEEGPDELELNDLCAEFLRADTTTEAATALGQRITRLTTACSAAAETAIPRQTSQHKSHLPEQSERVQQIRADWANKCNSSKFRQHPDFKRRRRRKIKAVEDARKLDRID